MQRITILILCLLSNLGVNAQISFKNKSIKEAFELGKAQGKAVFVEIYADGCPHCEHFKKTFESNKAVGEFYNKNFVNYQVEVNSEEGRKFRGDKNIYVMSTPLMTFWSADSTLLSIVPAGDEQNTEAGIIGFGQRALQPQSQWENQKKMYETGTDDDNFLINLAYLSRYTCDTLLNIGAMQRYAQKHLADDFSDPINYVVAQKVLIDDENPLFLHLVNQREKYYAEHGKEEVNQVIENILMFSLYSPRAKNFGFSKLAFMKDVLRKIGVSEQSIRGRFLLIETQKLFEQSQAEKAVGLINDFYQNAKEINPNDAQYIEKYVKENTQDAALLSQLAWIFAKGKEINIQSKNK